MFIKLKAIVDNGEYDDVVINTNYIMAVSRDYENILVYFPGENFNNFIVLKDGYEKILFDAIGYSI